MAKAASSGHGFWRQPEERTGVEEVACRHGWSVNWGDPPAPVAKSIAAEAGPGISVKRNPGPVRRESERDVVPLTVGTT